MGFLMLILKKYIYIFNNIFLTMGISLPDVWPKKEGNVLFNDAHSTHSIYGYSVRRV